MPWPRRSKATSRNSSASALSYCFTQQRWFCDQPWMNRIGGPSASAPLAHVQPQTAAAPHGVSLHSPGSPLRSLCSALIAGSSPRRLGSIVAGRAVGAHRAEGLIFRPRRALSLWPGYLMPRTGGSRERRLRRTRTRARGARARARRDARREAVRPSSSPEKPASARRGSASELAGRARDAGFEVLLGRSIDLVGTELPYQPFVEALRPLGEPRLVDGQTRGSQLRVFEETLALLTERAAAAPVLLVLEDLHWADTSTLDLTVFLAHNLDGRPVLLLATYRADEPSSARAHAPTRRARPAFRIGGRARARAARARGVDGAARGSQRRLPAGER